MKLYEAEDIIRKIFDRSSIGVTMNLYGVSLVLPQEKVFSDYQEIQNYIDSIVSSADIYALYRPQAVRVRRRKGNNAAHYEQHNAVIAIPDSRWALREMVILHEIAHHLHHEQICRCNATHARDSKIRLTAPHGQDFLEAYVTVCQIALGEQAAFLVRTIFIDAGLWGKNST